MCSRETGAGYIDLDLCSRETGAGYIDLDLCSRETGAGYIDLDLCSREIKNYDFYFLEEIKVLICVVDKFDVSNKVICDVEKLRRLKKNIDLC